MEVQELILRPGQSLSILLDVPGAAMRLDLTLTEEGLSLSSPVAGTVPLSDVGPQEIVEEIDEEDDHEIYLEGDEPSPPSLPLYAVGPLRTDGNYLTARAQPTPDIYAADEYQAEDEGPVYEAESAEAAFARFVNLNFGADRPAHADNGEELQQPESEADYELVETSLPEQPQAASPPAEFPDAEALVEIAAEPVPEPESEPSVPAMQIESDSPPDAGEYSVLLTPPRTDEKKRLAAELIAQLKQVDEGQAKRMTGKMVVPLAKGVSREDAIEIRDVFKAAGLTCRIAKKR